MTPFSERQARDPGWLRRRRAWRRFRLRRRPPSEAKQCADLEKWAEANNRHPTIEDKLRADYMAGSLDSMESDTIEFILAVEACDDLDATAPAYQIRPMTEQEREDHLREKYADADRDTPGSRWNKHIAAWEGYTPKNPQAEFKDADGHLLPARDQVKALREKRRELERVAYEAQTRYIASAAVSDRALAKQTAESMKALDQMIVAQERRAVMIDPQYDAMRDTLTKVKAGIATVNEARAALGAIQHDYETRLASVTQSHRAQA